MKLVIQYESGDGCTYSATNYIACEAESKDELQLLFLIELEPLLEQKNDSNLHKSHYFKFQSHTLDLNSFIDFDKKSKKYIVDGTFEFLTLDEFWESQLNQDFGY